MAGEEGMSSTFSERLTILRKEKGIKQIEMKKSFSVQHGERIIIGDNLLTCNPMHDQPKL